MTRARFLLGHRSAAALQRGLAFSLAGHWFFTNTAGGILWWRRARIDGWMLSGVTSLFVRRHAVADADMLASARARLSLAQPLRLAPLDFVDDVFALPLASGDLVMIRIDVDVFTHDGLKSQGKPQ